MLPVGLVDPGEILQVLDDLLHPGQALGALIQQLRQVFFQVVQLHRLLHAGQPGAQCGVVRRQYQAGLRVDQLHQRIDILAQRVEVRADEAHRVVDLVGHAGGQLADRGHLVGLQQLVLRLLQLLVGGLQLLEAAAQFLLRGAHLAAVLQHPPDAGVRAGQVDDIGVDLDPDRSAVRIVQPHLVMHRLALRQQGHGHAAQRVDVGRRQVEIARTAV